MSAYFESIGKIVHEGSDSENPLAFRWHDANREVMGKTMEEHLRFAICYWHTFCWPDNDLGKDILGGHSSMADLADHVAAKNTNPEPVSGRQEALENLVNRYL